MLKYNIYIGCKDKDSKLPNLKCKVKEVTKEVLKQYEIKCYTLLDSLGCYEYSNGMVANEETIIIEIVSDNNKDTRLKELCTSLKTILNQECIMLTKQVLDVEFI